MQPLPPIIVNVPPASGPPWWATALIAFGSAIFGILITAYIARGREHQKWLWEQRCQFYVQMLSYIDDAASTRSHLRSALAGSVEIDNAQVHWPDDPAEELSSTGELFASDAMATNFGNYVRTMRRARAHFRDGWTHRKLDQVGLQEPYASQLLAELKMSTQLIALIRQEVGQDVKPSAEAYASYGIDALRRGRRGRRVCASHADRCHDMRVRRYPLSERSKDCN